MTRRLFPRAIVFFLCFALLTFAFLTFAALFLPVPQVYAQDEVIVAGRVTAEGSSDPIPDIKIVLFDAGFPGHWEVGATDSSGYYTVTEATVSELTPGNFHLYFQSQGTYVSEFYDNVTGTVSAEVLHLNAITPTLGIDAALIEGGLVLGKITDENDQPLPDGRFASIDILDENGAAIQRELAIDESGTYTASGILPGSYSIYGRPAGGDRLHVAEYYPDAMTRAEAQIVEISPGETITGIDFSLILGGSISGTLASDTRGAAVYPQVEVYDEQGELFTNWRLIPDSITSSYVIANLPPASFRVRFADEQEDHRPEFYDNQPTLESATPITVTAGEITTINVDLAYIPRVHSIATSSALTDTILLTLNLNPMPRYTTNNGGAWHELAYSPWVKNDEFMTPNIGLSPRMEPGLPQRFMVMPGNGYGNGDSALYRSGDFGATWTTYFFSSNDCTWQEFSNVFAELNPPTKLYLVHTCVITVFSGYIRNSSLYISDNSGLDWVKVGPIAFSSPDSVLLSPVVAERLYMRDVTQWEQSDDDGKNWTEVDFPVATLALDAQDAQRLYGITPYTVTYDIERVGMRSEDGGATWEEWAQQPCAFGADPYYDKGNVQLMAHPTVSQTLFVRCDQGLYRSEDGGDSWEKLEDFPGQLLAVDHGHPGRLLWGRDDGLWASSDNGDTWQNIMPDYALQEEINYLPGISVGEIVE